MFSAAKSNAPVSGPYTLSKSLRLRRSASAYLSRTPASAGNRRTWTWSGWVKRGLVDANNGTFFASNGASDYIQFTSEYTLRVSAFNGGNYIVASSAVYLDPSAWYHIVVGFDSTQATASNRIKIYVNGSQITSFSANSYPTQNYDTQINNNVIQYIGTNIYNYFDGEIADVYLIEGQQLTPSSFGATDATSGQWVPARYSGTYGTNGFHLPFTNVTSTTTLGYDTSGNSNNWTTNNISLTASSTYDSMNDVPVAYSATAANYAVLNPNAGSLSSIVNITDGNLSQSSVTGSGWSRKISSIGFTSGKFYAEFTVTTVGDNALAWGITNSPPTADTSNQNGQLAGYSVFIVAYFSAITAYNRLYPPSGTYSTLGGSSNVGDVYGIAINADTNTVYFYQNGSVLGSAGGYTLTSNGTPYFFQSFTQPGGAGAFNFGQQGFKYTPPSGYNALNTYNLPTPTIVKSSSYMNAVTYTGNGDATAQAITGVGFKPDFVWLKGRSGSYEHILSDSVRGAGKILYTSLTNAEATVANFVSFDTDGFTVNANGGASSFNANGSTYVAWNWKANQGTTVTNTNGSITSTVSANTTAGFSIVTYTGNGTAGATVGHGLGVAPSMIIVKGRSGLYGADHWAVYHASLGATRGFNLDLFSAAFTSTYPWNDTAPTSTVWTNGSGAQINSVSTTYVAYCFAQIAGFSAFGTYVGNGSASGPFVYCGFKPKFVMVKCVTSVASTNGDGWHMEDTARNTYNSLAYDLLANAGLSETDIGTGNYYINFLSNGFQIANSYGYVNNSGTQFIYIAFASNPFKYSNAF